MRPLTLLGVFAIGLAALIAACQGNQTTVSQQASSDVTWAEVIPIDVERFIRNSYRDSLSKRPMVLVVEHALPYPRSFNVLSFGDDNSVSEWREVPDWAVQGIHSGVFTDSEKADILNDCAILQSSLFAKTFGRTDAEQDRYIIWFSYATPDGYELLSCSGSHCPQEICTLYEIADSILKRHQGIGLPCPMSQQ